MPEIVPSAEQMTILVGKPLYEIWTKLCALIDEKYDMERLWGSGGKAWTYEYKYRRGGKTLCALYARENCIGFMVILGKDERLKFENTREHYAPEVQTIFYKGIMPSEKVLDFPVDCNTLTGSVNL